MTTTVTTETTKEPTFGNWARPTSPGILGQGLLGTVVIIGGMVAGVTAMIASGITAGLIVLALVVAVLAPLTVRLGGRSAGQYLLAKFTWWRGSFGRRTLYRSGALSTVPAGKHALPGLAASAKLHEFETAFGVPFGLVEHPHVGLWVTVIRCLPDGAAGLDASVLDARVGGWARFLGSLARLNAVVAAQQVVEVAPDSGTRLRAEGERLTEDDAPAIARAMMAEATAEMPSGQFSLTSRTAIVWETPPGVAKRGKAERAQAMAEFVAGYLPGICSDLLGAGAGKCRPMTGQEIAEDLRMAYDPDSTVKIETARGTGKDSEVTWADCGPVAADDQWGVYRHDGAVSITWAMTHPPEGHTYRGVLASLLDGDSVMDRRRLCLTYRPFDAAEGKRKVKRELKNAIMRSGQDRIGDVGDDLVVGAHRQSQKELGQGASLVSFSMHVTATVKVPASGEVDLDLVEATIEQAASDFHLRRCWGHQAAAFTAGLGVGVIPAKYVRVPEAIRSTL